MSTALAGGAPMRSPAMWVRTSTAPADAGEELVGHDGRREGGPVGHRIQSGIGVRFALRPGPSSARPGHRHGIGAGREPHRA